jgi:sarcosine oxidase
MAEHFDVIVVGAGAAGSSAAWWLARRGRRVLVLEQFAALHDRGSSHGTERIFRLGYTDPAYVELALEALPLWRELEREAGVGLLTTTGVVDFGFPEELDELAAAYDSLGVRWERLDVAAARRRFPGIDTGGDALLQPDGGRTDADATLAALHAQAARHGASLAFSQPVLALDLDGAGAVVRTGARTARAPVVVLATGAWAGRLLGGSVALPPVAVTKEQVAFFRPESDGAWPSFIHRAEPSVYGMGTPGGLVKVGEHYTGPPVDPDTRDFDVEPVTWQRLLAWAYRRLPGVDPEPVGATTCLYASTPDEDFVLDRVGPVVLGLGLGGHGFKFVPAIGRRLADLADLPAGESPPPGPFSLERSARHAGRSGHK